MAGLTGFETEEVVVPPTKQTPQETDELHRRNRRIIFYRLLESLARLFPKSDKPQQTGSKAVAEEPLKPNPHPDILA